MLRALTRAELQVHYACCCALAYLAVRQDVRAALYESTVGPLMEALDLFVRRYDFFGLKNNNLI